MQSPASANVPTTSFDDRFGSGSVRSSRVISYPWRTASRPLRTDFDAEFGHIEGQLGGQPRDVQTVQPEQPAPSAEAAVPAQGVQGLLAADGLPRPVLH